jgi:hypothetical protein
MDLPHGAPMTESAPSDFSPQPPVDPATRAAADTRRRRWPKVLLGLVLLLVLLVLLAPTIASTAPVRAFVLSKVNENLNGRVEVRSWTAGWFGGFRVEGVRVFDADNAQILQLKSLTTELTLFDAVRGRLHLGKVAVDSLDALAKSDADGTLNFAKLEKSSPSQPDVQTPPGTPTRDEPIRVPDLTGELQLVNCSATYEDGRSAANGGTGQTFHFPLITGALKFPDLNKPIENNLEVSVRVGDQPTGKITVKGSIDAIENHIVDPATAAVEQAIELHDLELASLSFALGREGAIQKLAGLTDGIVSVSVQPAGPLSVMVAVKGKNILVGGTALKGDTYQTSKLDLAVGAVVDRSAAPDDYTKWTVRAASEASPSLRLTTDQGTITAAAQAPVQALLNLAENKAPGAAGFVRTNVDLDIGALAKQLPNLLAVKKGLTITGGRLKQATDVTLAADRAEVKTLTLDLTGVAGTDATRGGAAVALQPIHLAVNATSFGGGGPIPDLRDLKLTLQSAFANGTIQGRSIAETNGTLTADLRGARDELSKVLDLGALQLAGTLQLDLSSQGDLVNEKRAAVKVTLAGTDVEISGIKETPPLRQPRLAVVFNGTVFGGATSFVERVENVTLTAQAGDARSPTLAAELTGRRIDLPAADAPTTAPAAAAAPATAPPGVTAQGMQVKRLNVNLAQAQREFAAFVPALHEMGLDFSAGSLDLTASGDYDGKAATYEARVALTGVNLNKTPKPDLTTTRPLPPRAVLANYSAMIGAAGGYAALDNDRAQVTLKTFSVDGKIFSLAKAGDRDLSVTTGPGGITPSAALSIAADLKQVNDLLAALSDEPVQIVVQGGAGASGLRSGKLSGVIELQPFENEQFRVSTRDLKLTELTAAGEGGAAALTNETLAIDLQARPSADLSAVAVDRLTVNGRLANVSVEKAQLVLTIGKGDAARPATVPEMVQSATVKANLPNLGQIQSLIDALVGPAPGPKAMGGPVADQYAQARGVPVPAKGAAPAADAAAPPTRFGGGSLAMTVNVERAGERTVVTPDVAARDVVLLKGPARDTLQTLTVSTQLSYVPVPPLARVDPAIAGNAKASAAAPAAPTLLESLRDVQVPKLEVNVVRAGSEAPVVRLALAEPLSVSNPAALSGFFASLADPKAAAPAGDVPTLRTALTGGGDFGELMALLAVLSADASPARPYAGTYTLDQKLSAGKEGLAAAGVIRVADLSVKGPNGTFAEKSVRVANDVSLDAGKQILSIRDVSLAMEATKALELALRGTVRDFNTTRTLEAVGGTIGYDWAQVRQIVEPMLDPETRKSLKLTLAGKGSKPFTLAGSYPAGKPFNEAVRSLAGSLELGFDQLNCNEIDARNLLLPVVLKDGVATIAYADKPAGSNYPPPAPCNSGLISLGGASVDLTADVMRLNMPKGTKVLDKVGLNPYFSNTLGDFINNPAFVSPTTASGTVSVTVEECNQFPLGDLDPAAARRDPGRAVILLSVTKLQLGNPMIVGILDQVAKRFGGDFAEGSLQGEIKESRIVMAKGEVHQELVIATGEQGREVRLVGGANLQTQQLLAMNFVIGPRYLGKDVAKYLPDGLPIALGGTTHRVKWDVGRSANELLGNKIKDPKALTELLGDVLGGNKEKPRTPAAPTTPNSGAANDPDAPAAEPMKEPKDPVGGLLDDLLGGGGGKKETDREKEERRARNRRERELEAERKAAATQPASTQPAPKERKNKKRK